MAHSYLAQALVTAGLIKSVRDVKPKDYDGLAIAGVVEKIDIYGAICGNPIKCTGANAAKRLLIQSKHPIIDVVFGERLAWALTSEYEDGKQVVIRLMHSGRMIDQLNDEGKMNETIGKKLTLMKPDARRALGARPNTWGVRPSKNYTKRTHAATCTTTMRKLFAFAQPVTEEVLVNVAVRRGSKKEH